MSRKLILPVLLLGMILLSFLILPNFSSMPTLTSEQSSQTQNYIVRDNVPPKPSAPAPDIFMNKTSNIIESADDAWNRPNPVPRTDYITETLPLGGHRQSYQAAQRRVCLHTTLETESLEYLMYRGA